MKASLLFLPMFATLTACGPLGDLGHKRESAVVRASLQIGELSFEANGQEWAADPTAGCEISEAPKDDLHNRGTFRFVMAANEADPVAFAADLYLAPDGRLSSYYGLYAQGQSDWSAPLERCSLTLTDADYDEREFAFAVDCTFEREQGAEQLVVHGTVRAQRCYDPSAISFERAGELASDLGRTAVDLGEAFAEDPVGFATTIALLPLYAMGGGH